MHLAIRIAAAILSVPPDVLAPMVPMLAPPPRNALEFDLRDEVYSALSGHCSSAGGAPLFALSREEVNYVNCNSGLPYADETLYKSSEILSDDETASPKAATYGEITMLGARQLFHQMGLTNNNNANTPSYQFFDLGSGGGRLVMQSHLELPSVFKSVGIELSPSRHKVALETWDNLLQNGDAGRIRKLAERSWGVERNNNDNIIPNVELHEGDLYELDISRATHMYVSSLCFSEDMLERLVDKIEREGTSLQVVASLRLLPTLQEGDVPQNDEAKIKRVTLGSSPWQEFVEMSWTKARGDGCPVYFYSVKNLNDKFIS